MWRWLLLRVHYVAEILFLLRQGTKTWIAVACANQILVGNMTKVWSGLWSLLTNGKCRNKYNTRRRLVHSLHRRRRTRTTPRETIVTLEEEENEEGRSGRSDYWDVVGCCHGQKGRTGEHTWDLKARTLLWHRPRPATAGGHPADDQYGPKE